MIQKPKFPNPNHFYIPLVTNALGDDLINSLEQSCNDTIKLISEISKTLEDFKQLRFIFKMLTHIPHIRIRLIPRANEAQKSI